jgi:alanine racemase
MKLLEETTLERPAWAEIDLAAIAHNTRRLRQLVKVPLIAVMKADAYGHGAVRVAPTLLDHGAQMLAVATLAEGRALREAGIAAPLLVLGYTPPWQAANALALNLTCTMFDDETALAFNAAAAELRIPARVHVKVDTGMARLGLTPRQVGPFLARLRALPLLLVEGLYTHFSSADQADPTPTRRQLVQFATLIDELSAAGLRPSIVHAANSAGLLGFPEARFDMVRPGIALYGLAPSAACPLPTDFQPALSLHCEIAQLKEVAAKTPLSYGGHFVTQRRSQIATIPLGYADGLRRSPPWREVLVGRRRAPIVGTICMDYALVDVSDVPGVQRGDVVTLIGRQGNAVISADEVAGWLGTIAYEVLVGILPRVPRVHG